MRTYKATLSYDGTNFLGWQFQPRRRTLQGAMQDAVKAVVGLPVKVIGSSRTDAGVHAIGQVASFTCDSRIPPASMKRALNTHLPDDILVRDVEDAPLGFHAIRDTYKKRYRYVIQDGPDRDLFARPFAWYVRAKLDEKAMHRAGQHLVGTHDFDSFESTGSRRVSTIRTILDVSVERRQMDSSSRVVIEVEADGFLYSMVRNIAGTLAEIGKGKRPEHWPLEVIAARDRRQAGMAAPPQGLFLLKVDIDYEGRHLATAGERYGGPLLDELPDDEAPE